ncbi:MAG: chemotaxis protein CheW [Deltaproteobacteria bacterium]|nr:chemotaxis protein CheW [Deltaproteobacteria bacterium]
MAQSLDFAQLYKRLDEADERLSRPLDPAAQQALLEKRAHTVARKVEHEQVDELSVLGFTLGEERYAVKVHDVEMVLTAKRLAPLAGAPRFVLGAAVVRSRIVPVLDLRHLLGRAGRSASDLTGIVAVAVGEERFALAVEHVEGQLDLPKSTLGPPPPGPYLHVGADQRAILDLSRLLEQAAREGQ